MFEKIRQANGKGGDVHHRDDLLWCDCLDLHLILYSLFAVDEDKQQGKGQHGELMMPLSNKTYPKCIQHRELKQKC